VSPDLRIFRVRELADGLIQIRDGPGIKSPSLRAVSSGFPLGTMPPGEAAASAFEALGRVHPGNR